MKSQPNSIEVNWVHTPRRNAVPAGLRLTEYVIRPELAYRIQRGTHDCRPPRYRLQPFLLCGPGYASTHSLALLHSDTYNKVVGFSREGGRMLRSIGLPELLVILAVAV